MRGIHIAVELIFEPLIVFFLCMAIAAMLMLVRLRGAAVRVCVASILCLYAISTDLVGGLLLRSLESAYSPIPDARLENVPYVVVLGSGYAPRDGVPVTGALSADGLARVVEGVRILGKMGDAKLVLSGGAESGVPSARGYELLSRQLGVPEERIVVLDQPLDTAEEAAAISGLVGDSRFYLVTSAYHMRRAVRLMAAHNLSPLPAPTNQVLVLNGSALRHLIPSARNIGYVERAIHEYLGLMALAV